MVETEPELIRTLQRCARRDHLAFASLYLLTSKPLYAVTRRILKDDDRAKDAFQRAFLSIWRKAGGFDPAKGRAFTWMLVIVRNEAIDEWRRIQRQRRYHDLCPTLEDSAALPDEQAELVRIRTLLRAEVARLPEGMARVIRRRFLHGQPAREIAADLDIPLNTVRSWIQRGLELLRRALPMETAQEAMFAA